MILCSVSGFSLVRSFTNSNGLIGVDKRNLNSIAFRRLRQLAPALLSDCPSLRYVSFNDAILPAFPPDDSANASDGQAVAKWLFTTRPDGMPKWLKFSVNSPDQWSSTVEQLKTAFSNASSPVTFCIFLRFSSTLIDSVVPFDLINEVTGEQLTLQQYGTDDFLLSRCPIGWDLSKWENVRDEVLNDNPMNHIHFLIRDADLTNVFSTPLLPDQVVSSSNSSRNE